MANKTRKIAILGATSHIAKGLIYGFLQKGESELQLFARSPDRVHGFLAAIGCREDTSVMRIEAFPKTECDVIINCVGIGDPGKLRGAEATIFRITEDYDNLILAYLENHPQAIYVNMSSGAVYGMDFAAPVDASRRSAIDVNKIAPAEYYGLAKLHAEAKHRAFPKRSIVDLRIFSYFSRFMDPQSKFLLSEVMSCIRQGKSFETGPDNIIRDYVHPQDLLSLIEACSARKALNAVFDVYSLKPVSKFEILDFLGREYGLRYHIKDAALGASPTGSKDHYYSLNRKAGEIGYSPRFASIDCIKQESRAILT